MCCYSGTIDDDFGSGTENAVKKYQRSKGISDDGMVGAQTWDALASFAYNCGIGALLSQSTLYKRVCSGVRDESLRKNFTDWCHSGGEVSQGLVNRRNEECDMFLYGDYNIHK